MFELEVEQEICSPLQPAAPSEIIRGGVSLITVQIDLKGSTVGQCARECSAAVFRASESVSSEFK